MYDTETSVTIVILLSLSLVYIYLLFSPSQPRVPLHNRPFILKPSLFSQAAFDIVQQGLKDAPSSSKYTFSKYDDFNYSFSSEMEFGSSKGSHTDDFFLDGYESQKGKDSRSGDREESNAVVIPSSKYICQDGWISIRSEMNYKYLWMHSTEKLWMGATATIDTPLHRKSFKMIPANESCENGGWVILQEGDTKGFLFMVEKTANYNSDEWVVKIGTENVEEAKNDTQYHFLIEEAGYVLNKRSMAFVTVMPEAEYSVRGHSGGWDRSKPAGREYGSMMHFNLVNSSLVEEAIQKEWKEEKAALKEDKKRLKLIASYPTSTEKRVISFGLYGSNPKYTVGAVKNAKLAKIYYPGWIPRYYVTSDVPASVIDELKELGAEIERIPGGKGYSSGMFWRFMVASDPTVDRYIVRDTDSRLNARERIAVEEWIESKYPVHIMRDHVNHCIVMNGGMWGGTKDAVRSMSEKISAWSSRDEYMADLHFLDKQIWPDIKNSQLSHDSYCCDRFPNARPFPTQRDMTYQHVGQVFDDRDNIRLMDIDGFIRGVPVPGSCRKRADWIYG
mmetsp:Transcript_28150/g.38699  ORF Transcript_28150/g.38699 Transcript_28150/m.38699 type:complete len:560 (-) Transcript_28150:12-1691(-)